MTDKELKENTIKAPLLVKNIQTGIPTRTISIAATVGFIATYTHFFGLSYLEGAGFESINITLSPDESIFYACHGFMRALGRLISSDFITFNWSYILPGFSFAAVFFSFWLVKKTPFMTKLIESKEKSTLGKQIGYWFNGITDSYIKTLVFSIIGFIIGNALPLLSAVFIIFVLSIFWLLMSLGIGAGESDGSKLLQEPICRELVWEDSQEDRILGCRVIILKDKSELKGLRLHNDDKTTYFLTNKGSYEISKGNEIITFRPIHERPESKSEDAPKAKK